MGAPVWGAVWKAIVSTAISYATSAIANKLFGPKAQNNSPTYAFGRLQTQTNSGMVMPLIYGRVKCAGNMIWASDAGKIQHKVISFGVGRIKGFIDVKGNDMYLETKYEQRPALTITYSGSSPTATVVVNTHNGNQSITCNDGINGFSVITNSRLFNKQVPNEAIENNINIQSGWHCEIMVGGLCNLIDLPTTNVKGIPCTIKYNAVIQEGLPGCSYTQYVGDGEQLIDNRVPGATQEDKAKVIGGLKYDAYLAITATASDHLTGDYNVTAIVDGRIVKIYTSPTTFYEDWSDNPAWCFLDFMTSVDGCGMQVSENDIHTFISAAAYYSELVNGKKRFIFNMIMDEKKSRQDWLDEILITCRSYRTYQRGLHGILVDKPESVSQIFKVKPDESIETWWQDNAEDIERLQIEYIDHSYQCTKVVAQADRVQLPGETSQFRNKSPLIKKISIYGINNFEQASREAWFHLNKAQTCPEWIQYTTNKKALNRSIGDVVGVQNPITEVHEEGLDYKRYRIMSMTEPQENKISMVMQEYNPNLYTDAMSSVAPVVNIIEISSPFNDTIPNITNVTATQTYYRQKDGTIISDVILSYTLPDYLYFNKCVIRITDDNWITWGIAGYSDNNKFTVHNTIVGKKYKMGIHIENRVGRLSSGVEVGEVYITGKDTPPSDVTNFNIGQNGDKLYFSWALVPDPDVDTYEIREGISVETGSLFASISNNNTYETSDFTSGDKTYWIRAIDRSGNYSAHALSRTITIADRPKRNLILGFTAIANHKANVRYMNENWLMNDSEIYMSDIIKTGTEYVDITDTINLDAVIKSAVQISYSLTAHNAAQIVMQLQTSVDGIHFSEWQNYVYGEYVFQYLNIRAKIDFTEATDYVELQNISVSIDVPDRNEKGLCSIAVAGWTHFDFPETTYPAPTAWSYFDGATWQDINGKTWSFIEGKTWKSFDGRTWDEVEGKAWNEVELLGTMTTRAFHALPEVWVVSQTFSAHAYKRNVTKTGFEAILVVDDGNGNMTPVKGEFRYEANGF